MRISDLFPTVAAMFETRSVMSRIQKSRGVAWKIYLDISRYQLRHRIKMEYGTWCSSTPFDCCLFEYLPVWFIHPLVYLTKHFCNKNSRRSPRRSTSTKAQLSKHTSFKNNHLRNNIRQLQGLAHHKPRDVTFANKNISTAAHWTNSVRKLHTVKNTDQVSLLGDRW